MEQSDKKSKSGKIKDEKGEIRKKEEEMARNRGKKEG